METFCSAVTKIWHKKRMYCKVKVTRQGICKGPFTLHCVCQSHVCLRNYFDDAIASFCSSVVQSICMPLGDKVSMLTHTYPHKARRKIEVTICKITRLTAHFMCGLMSDLLICTCLYLKVWSYMTPNVLTETRCR